MAWAGPVTPLRAGASLPGRSGASLTSQTDVVCGVSQATRLPAVRGLPSLTLLLAIAALRVENFVIVTRCFLG